MSELSIPLGLDPQGIRTPIEEAQSKSDYYRCPECGEFLTPRIGPKRQYFAHKQGVLEDTSCPLSSQEGIEEMMEDLRMSNIEKGEQKRTIRSYIGQRPGGVELFGVVPSLSWDSIPNHVNIDTLLEEIDIEAKGITHPPVASNFHPAEPEVVLDLDPQADQFELQITGPDTLEAIIGSWTAPGLQHGNLFVGEENRARRHGLSQVLGALPGQGRVGGPRRPHVRER